MKKLLALILLLVILIAPTLISFAIDEVDLQKESSGKMALKETTRNIVRFQGYVNSKDVTIVADVMGCIYNLCNHQENKFCADEQGALIVGGSDTGHVISLIKKLDEAISNNKMVSVELTMVPYYAGAKKIVNVTILNSI